MPKPVRMNLMRVVIIQTDKAATRTDSDFRQEIGSKQRPTEIILQGQVNLGTPTPQPKVGFQRRGRTGDAAQTRGRINFRKRDLDALSVTLNEGDRVDRVGPVGSETILDAEIVEVRPESPLNGDFLLIVAEMEQIKEQSTPVR